VAPLEHVVHLEGLMRVAPLEHLVHLEGHVALLNNK
jgi:hypothetical protein